MFSIKSFSLFVLCVSILIAGRAQAQNNSDQGAVQRFEFKKPPSGTLIADQLRAVSATIHRLEQVPLAPGAAEAQKDLFTWLTGSPDITVDICGSIMTSLADDNSGISSFLALQFLLSQAAFKIDHSGEVDNSAAVTRAGIEGVLIAYRKMKAQRGSDVKHGFAEKMLKKQDKGDLDRWVEKESCKG